MPDSLRGVLPPLKIRNARMKYPVVQGGMGVGVSMEELASAVSREDGLGTLSSACLDRLVSRREGREVEAREAAEITVRRAKEMAGGRPIAMNVMVALEGQYEDSVMGAFIA